MDIQNAIAALPAVPHGHLRVIRVERKLNPRKGGAAIAGDWWHLPTPWNDGYNGELGELEGYDDKGPVCATLDWQFHFWWSDLTPEKLEDRHVVALDVPKQAACVLGKQVMIKREEAKLVAVLH